MTDETNKANGQTEAPESFPPELLVQPVEARLEYFGYPAKCVENLYRTNHTKTGKMCRMES